MATILIVDDEAEIRNRIYSALSSSHIVLEASNGREGLFLFDLYHPDLVITDFQMPVMSGSEFIQRLRSMPDNEQVKIIAISESSHYSDERKTLLNVGADQCLTKPIDINNINETVTMLLLSPISISH